MATIRQLRGRWQAMVRKKGTIPRCRSFDRRVDALAWATQLEAEADRVGMVGDARLAHKVTLADVLMRYRDQCSPGKRGAHSERARLAAMARDAIGQCTLARLSSSAVAGYRDARLAKVSPATVVRELSIMQTVVETASQEWGIPLPRNPVAGVRRPTVRNDRRRRLNGGEEARLLDAAAIGSAEWIGPLIAFAIETGMRRSELLALTWADIDLDSRVALVRSSKNGESRDVPLSVRAVQIAAVLRHDYDNSGKLEAECGGPVFAVSASAVRSAFERVRARAGAPDLRFHDLRREGVTRLIERGLNLIEASSVSGHRDLRMLKRYVVPSRAGILAKLDRGELPTAPSIQG
jgi:integrase